MEILSAKFENERWRGTRAVDEMVPVERLREPRWSENCSSCRLANALVGVVYAYSTARSSRPALKCAEKRG